MTAGTSNANWNVSTRLAVAVTLLLEACILVPVRGQQADLIASDSLQCARPRP